MDEVPRVGFLQQLRVKREAAGREIGPKRFDVLEGFGGSALPRKRRFGVSTTITIEPESKEGVLKC